MPKNVLIIKSSPREKGNSSVLAEQATTGAIQAGATVESIWLHRYSIQPCNACDGCRETKGICIINDDMQLLYPHLEAADGIIFASPIYWFTFNAQLKLMIDRLYAFEWGTGKGLRGKKVGIILTYGDSDLYTSGGINAIHTFESMARYVKFEIAGMVYGSANAIGDVQKDVDLMEKAFKLGMQLGSE